MPSRESTAFARGGLLRFGIDTLLRGPAIVFRLLAALLVVWTILLAPTFAAMLLWNARVHRAV